MDSITGSNYGSYYEDNITFDEDDPDFNLNSTAADNRINTLKSSFDMARLGELYCNQRNSRMLLNEGLHELRTRSDPLFICTSISPPSSLVDIDYCADEYYYRQHSPIRMRQVVDAASNKKPRRQQSASLIVDCSMVGADPKLCTISLESLLSSPGSYGQPESNHSETIFTLEELRHHLNSCFSCGVNWSQDHVSLDCLECGGYAMWRPCPKCDGLCQSQWKRDVTSSHALHKAQWSGDCLTADGFDRPMLDNNSCSSSSSISSNGSVRSSFIIQTSSNPAAIAIS